VVDDSRFVVELVAASTPSVKEGIQARALVSSTARWPRSA
jgi:hypothetical protein